MYVSKFIEYCYESLWRCSPFGRNSLSRKNPQHKHWTVCHVLVMSEESEEAYLVNPRSPSLSGFPPGLMPYTDGVQSVVSQYGAQMNSAGSLGSNSAGLISSGRSASDASGTSKGMNRNDRNSGTGVSDQINVLNPTYHLLNINNNRHNIYNNILDNPEYIQTGSSGRGSQSHESESGELIDYNNDLLLSQFHADAIKQVSELVLM